MTVISVSPGGRPKRDIIDIAYEALGSAGYEFERTPEEVRSALRILDLMMQEWPWDGLGYYFPPVGNGAAEDLSGLNGAAVTAVAYELAQRLGGTGMTLTPAQLKIALQAKNQAIPPSVPTMPYARNTPAGAGNRFWRRTFLPTGD